MPVQKWSLYFLIPILSHSIDHGWAQNQLAGGGYYCHLICLASQLDGHSLTMAKENCKKYDRNDFCISGPSICKKDCPDLIAPTGSGPSMAPGNVKANYSTDPEPNPYLVDLQWEKISTAKLYVIEYFQVGEKGDKDAGKILGHEESIDPKITIQRDNQSLCVQYGFRVAAVNQKGVGAFSNDTILEKPTPIYKTLPSQNSLKLKSMTYVKKEFHMDTAPGIGNGDSTDPNTVEAIFQYDLPPNWQPSDFAKARIDVTLLSCKNSSVMDAYPTPVDTISTDRAEVIISVPGKIVEAGCKYFFIISGLDTKCGTKVTFADTGSKSISDVGLIVEINCTSVTNAPCKEAPEKKEPFCVVKDLNYKIVSKSDKKATVALTWGDTLSPKTWPVQYYVVRYSQSEKPSSDPVLSQLQPIGKNLGTVKTCTGSGPCDGKIRTVSLENLDLGNYFVAQICAIYDASLENVSWDIVARYSIDLTADGLKSGATTGAPGTPTAQSTAPATLPSTTPNTTPSSAFSIYTAGNSIVTPQTTSENGNGGQTKRPTRYFVIAVTLVLGFYIQRLN